MVHEFHHINIKKQKEKIKIYDKICICRSKKDVNHLNGVQ